MPEHVHLLLSEPGHALLATAINVLKFKTSKQLKGDREQFWQTRYDDVNILTHRRWLDALRYIHRKPMKRELGLRWSTQITPSESHRSLACNYPTLR